MKPHHIAVILDGNRRYARSLGLPTLEGHRRGYNKIMEMLDWCIEENIKIVTLYCFSTENFNRDKSEVDYLMDLFRSRFTNFSKDKRIHENKVQIKIVGRLDLFPKDVQDKMKIVMDDTGDYDQFTLNLALGYGGRSEIVEACKKINGEITEDAITSHLYVPEDVDMLIRPGGEKRISNFLLWQTSYAELYFCDPMWPAFTREEFDKALTWYADRKRRFGK